MDLGPGPQKLGNIASDRVIAVGDTRYDAEAAGKINVRTIRTLGFLYGGGNREELHQAGCIAMYKDTVSEMWLPACVGISSRKNVRGAAPTIFLRPLTLLRIIKSHSFTLF
jgi:hypothetical protein